VISKWEKVDSLIEIVSLPSPTQSTPLELLTELS